MKILLVSSANSNQISIGGKTIHQQLLERGLLELGNEVVTAYPEPHGRSIWERLRNKIRRRFNPDEAFRIYRDSLFNQEASIRRKVSSLLEKSSFDAISAQDPLSVVAVKNARKERRDSGDAAVVLTLHGYFAREVLNYGNFDPASAEKIKTLALGIESDAYAYADSVVTVDTRLSNYLVSDFNCKKPVNIVFNGIDDSRFYPVTEEEKQAFRERLRMGKDEYVAFVARRLVKKNGVIYALGAIQELAKRGRSDVTLYVAGDGPQKKELLAYVKFNGLEEMVRYLGEISHESIDAYYKAADFILMPSVRSDDVEEATSLSMLEGLACGKVVIASDIGGMKEVIVHRQNGYLVREKDTVGIAEAILSCITDRQEAGQIGKKACQYASENHGYLAHAEKFQSIFAESVARAK